MPQGEIKIIVPVSMVYTVSMMFSSRHFLSMERERYYIFILFFSIFSSSSFSVSLMRFGQIEL